MVRVGCFPTIRKDTELARVTAKKGASALTPRRLLHSRSTTSHMGKLNSQIVLVTGCSTGIGRALAREFTGQGHRTFATARRIEALSDLDGCEHLSLDVTDAASIDRAVTKTIEIAGRIDVLVNNAGINLFGPLAEVPIDQLRGMFETNVTGTIAMCQAVIPHMAAQRSGRIVNIGSIVGVLPTPFAGAYCGTKAAVHMVSDVLRMEVAPLGIEVTTVQPGGVRSNISASGSVGLDRYAKPSSLYRKVHDQIVARANASQDRPMEADAFAKEIVTAVTQPRAPRMIRAGSGAALLPKARALPGAVLDRIMTRKFGLAALRE